MTSGGGASTPGNGPSTVGESTSGAEPPLIEDGPGEGLPLTVYLAGCRVLVVGAGPVAARKVRRLDAVGAEVTVVAPEAVAELSEAARRGRLTWHRRPFESTDVEGAALILAATASSEVNDRVAEAAAAQSTLCVRADGARHGTASFAAAVRRGPLTIAVSTDGAAPALARRVREELAERYDEPYGQLAALLGSLRRDEAVRAALAGQDEGERAARWRRAASPDILAMIRAGHLQRAKEVARTCLLSSSD